MAQDTGLRLVLLGPPGAGKGTQAAVIREKYGIPHISTGEILREAIEAGTELGSRVKSIVESGSLVPDELVGEVVAERLSREDATRGFLLDGFPRTLRQAEILETVLSTRKQALTAVIKIDLEDEAVVRRLSGRRSCASCGALYHVESARPRADGVCDACGGQLRQREDDTEEVIRKRLKVYHRQTAPLAGHYRSSGHLRTVDGDGTRDEVTARVLKALSQEAPA